jgi:hypothetical protein
MHFQKILSYDVYGPHQEGRFKYVCNLLNQTVDPCTLEPKMLTAHSKDVFISPRRRALSCLNQATAPSVTVVPALNEIPFDLERVCTSADFELNGSVAVRSAFLELFTNNQLALNHKTLQDECEHLLTISKDNPEALAISHTFRLRILETYLKTNRQLFDEPALLQKHLNPKEHWADFGAYIHMPT